MKRFDTLLSLAALTLAGALSVATTAAFAQETNDTTESENSDTGSVELNLGEEPKPEIGQAYSKEKFGDWDMRCLRTENPDDDPCQMYLLVNDQAGNPVSEVSMFRLPGDGQAKAGATIVVPLETALQDRLTIQIDGGAAKQYPFSFCNRLGCYARIGFTDDDIAAYKRGAVANLVIKAIVNPGENVVLPLSLTGFTAAFENVSVIQQ